VFARHLTSEWTFSKMPRLLTQQLQQARLGRETDTARLFLDTGITSWLAYFLAKKSSQGGYQYPGQRAEQLTISGFHQLAATDRKHPTVKSAIEGLLKRGCKFAVELLMLRLTIFVSPWEH
jgi:hypothetical protein